MKPTERQAGDRGAAAGGGTRSGKRWDILAHALISPAEGVALCPLPLRGLRVSRGGGQDEAEYVIHPIYLPYSASELSPHFPAESARLLQQFEKAARRYEEFLASHRDVTQVALSVSRRPRQLEQDPRVWAVSALKHLFDHPQRDARLKLQLTTCFGPQPPLADFTTWEDCLHGELALYFQVPLASPASYLTWLADHLEERNIIPFVLEAARRPGRRPLEGPTTLDAVLLNRTNGFAVLVMAHVTADCAVDGVYDSLRSQLTRTVDVMLEPPSENDSPLETRDPRRSLFCLLTPQLYREHPESRHYGAQLVDYMTSVPALQRDLPHRPPSALGNLPPRLGWLTFEDLLTCFPGACPWMTPP